jgi:F-type H+-transporting ATPase subunit a
VVPLLGSLQFPQIGELVDWKTLGGAGFNKASLTIIVASVIVLAMFFVAGRKKAMVPTGVQNLVEASVDFVADGIIMQTIGEEGMGFLPYLTTLFWFILVCNLFEIVPIFQFPPMARMAMPMVLALVTWVIYNGVGFKHQKLSYIKNSLSMPGLPKAILPLYALIEGLQILIVRPFSLAVRLFANMLAGHLLLVTFALLTDALIFHDGVKAGGFPLFSPLAILPLAMDIGITGFEVLVAVLQAFIFTILTAVYIGGSMHPEH